MSLRVSKIKIVFLVFITLNIIFVWYLLSSQQTTVLFSSYSTYSSEEDFQSLPEEDEEIHFLNLRTVGDAESVEELANLINIRKLILFAVHELNKPLKYTGCTKWWANPLDLDFYNTKFVSTTHSDHLIKFRIQPGNLNVVVKIRQQTSQIRLGDKELEIVSTFEIPNFQGKHCHAEHLSRNSTRICLCVKSKRFLSYNKTTTELWKNWQKTDTDLNTWPPSKSFLVEDYMNFTDYEWFVTSPGNTIQDLTHLGYSTEYCGPDIKMLIMISSAPSHFEQRKLIRETWGNSSYLESKGFKVVFLMGVPTDTRLNENVKREADITKDIIQANFQDSYHNLTISHLSMYKWAHLTCIEGRNKGVTVPQFLLKADDDFLINVDLALKVAQENPSHKFIGCVFCGGKAVRDLAYMTKYYTPRYMHISNSYTGYLSGVVYVLNTDVIPLLLQMSITTPMIHMDDAYVSGLLLRQLNIQPINSELFTYGRTEPDACATKQMVSSYYLDLTDMTTQWTSFIEPMPLNCTMENLKMKVKELTPGDIRGCFFNTFGNKR